MPRIRGPFRFAASRIRRPASSPPRARRRRPKPTCKSARESAGERSENNAQLISARSAVEKAELDLKRTKVVAPSRGVVTDLRTDVGQYAQPGAPAMTLIAVHDLWINADMTENNLGNIKPGDQVDIVLDVMPGEVLKGRVRSVGGGVGTGQPAQAGALPKIENSRDWLRQAQRFPVGGRVRSVRARAAATRCGSAARPTCWSTPATTV